MRARVLPPGHRLKIVLGLALCAWTSFAGHALAEPSTVRLKDGGLVRGELMEVRPNEVVRVHLADGSVREIPWAEIEGIEEPAINPSPAVPASEPSAAEAPAASDAPSEPTASSPVTSVDHRAEIVRLIAERDSIDQTGPVVMMIVGGGSFLLLGLPGLALLAVGEVCEPIDDELSDRGEEQCDNVSTIGGVLAAIGLVGGVVGVVGVVQVMGNSRERRQLNSRIEQLKQEQSLSLGVRPRTDGAELALRLQF